MGYLSSLTYYPDLNLGIFMSSTVDAFLGVDKTGALSFAIFDVIMQLQTWLTPSIMCATVPVPPNANTTGFSQTCLFPVLTKYLWLAGTFNHPLFGTVVVSAQLAGGNTVS